jgi:hypothetical protein
MVRHASPEAWDRIGSNDGRRFDQLTPGRYAETEAISSGRPPCRPIPADNPPIHRFVSLWTTAFMPVSRLFHRLRRPVGDDDECGGYHGIRTDG